MPTIHAPRLAGTPAMGSGRSHVLYQLTGDTPVSKVPIDAITEPEQRERTPKSEAVRELKASIATEGLLQPIGIKLTKDTVPKAYRVIYGAVRLRAWRELHADAIAQLQAGSNGASTKDLEKQVGRWEQIPAVVYAKEMPDDLCLEYELVENLDRADLTQDERMAHAGKLAELRAKRREVEQKAVEKDGTGSTTSTTGTGSTTSTKKKSGPVKGWFTIWQEDSKTPKNTAVNWWREFCAETSKGLEPEEARIRRQDLKPEAAQDVDKAAWQAWVKAGKASRDKAAADAAEAAAARAKAAEGEKALTVMQNSVRACLKLGKTIDEIAEAIHGALGNPKTTTRLIGALQIFEEPADG